MRNQVFLATASTVAFAGAASAQGAPPVAVPIFQWTGFYVGANLGAAFHHAETSNLNDYGGYTTPFFSSNSTGASYGAQFGYNWQIGQFVVGAEADMSAVSGASKTFEPANTLIPGGCGVTCHVNAANEINFISTVRGRIGVAFDRFMVYGTGGLAAGKVTNSWGYQNITPREPFVLDEVRLGYAAGGGIEFMIMPKVTLRAEALHVDLGTTQVAVVPQFSSMTFRTDFKNTANIARAGLNFVW